MPQLDHTGPEGQGAMTGRKAGKCTNFGAGRKKSDAPEKKNTDEEQRTGGGRGRGSRGGRGGRGGAGSSGQQGQGKGRGRGRGA